MIPSRSLGFRCLAPSEVTRLVVLAVDSWGVGEKTFDMVIKPDDKSNYLYELIQFLNFFILFRLKSINVPILRIR